MGRRQACSNAELARAWTGVRFSGTKSQKEKKRKTIYGGGIPFIDFYQRAHQPLKHASTVKLPSILAPLTSTSSVVTELTFKFPAMKKQAPQLNFVCAC